MASTVLVIGANRGIGLEVARQYAARGEKVIATCRGDAGGLGSIEGVEVHEGVDITDQESLRALHGKLEAGSLDHVMIVAGILRNVDLDCFDPEAVKEQFEVNALGPLQTVVALRDRIAEGGRIGLVTSRMGSIDDNTSGGSYGYRMSKAALNIAGKSLSLDLAPKGISVVILHPGYVRTDMTGNTGFIDAPESAEGLIARMDELTLDTTGRFMHMSGEELPW